MLNDQLPAPLQWWGSYDMAHGSSGYWHIGPLRLWIRRAQQELYIARERGDDPLDDSLSFETSPSETESLDATTSRYALQDAEESLDLMPALADRPLVVNPAIPFYLPPRQEATLFVSSALWFQIQVGSPPVVLEDEPTFRPSDTWFGPSTRSGELCYATKTRGRLQLEDVPLRPHRAVSAVRVRNRAESELLLNQLRLPMPNLSLFSSANCRLWTESLILDREADGGFASVRFEKGPPAEAGQTTRLAAPRRKTEGGFLFEAFGGFLSRKRENANE